MKEAATKADLAATEADPKAAIELTRLRLKVRLGVVLIANLVAVGLLLFATGLLLVP
jgi:hypothetical protein